MQEKVNAIHIYDCVIKLSFKILIVDMVISMITKRTYYIVTYYIKQATKYQYELLIQILNNIIIQNN